jgi:ABC-type tungstate transport system substrate-binding protein
VTVLTLAVAILAAYAFSRYEFRFKKPLNMIIISIQAVPPITLLIPYFGLIVALKLYNTYWALILTYMVFTLPYAILMMTGYFNTLPRNWMRRLWWTAPVLSPRCGVFWCRLRRLDCFGRHLYLYASLERVPFRSDFDQDR